MSAQLIATLILLPFALAFLYAGLHEYLRYRSEGRATYGLVYDEETGTTHVTGISGGADSYDPDEFDPAAQAERNTQPDTESEKT